MAANVLQHTTQAGERWDQIATEYYGSQKAEINGVDRSTIGLLIEANPGVPIYDSFPGGVIVNIPILDKVEIITDKEKLPPWKQ